MIEFRLRKAANNTVPKIFLDEAIDEIYNITGGYPRKINMLCHQILKELVVENQKIADRVFVRSLMDRQFGGPSVQHHDEGYHPTTFLGGQPLIG